MPRRSLRIMAVALALAAGLFTSAANADELADIQKLVKSASYPQALQKADAYIASKPRDPQGRFMKGLILTELGRSADAIAVFTRLTEDFPELPEPYNNLAVLYAQQKQYDKARTALEMAIRTHPAYAIAHENLGDVYARLASQAYGKALQIDSSNAVAQGKLALIRDMVSTEPRAGGKVAPARQAVALAPVKPAAPAPAAQPEPVKPAAAPVKPAAEVIPLASTPAGAAKPLPPVDVPKPAAAPAAAAPVEKPTPAPDAKPALPEAEVIAAAESWAAAWSKKDVNAYLAHYAPSFKVPGGKSRKAWETERRQRIDRPGRIEVKLSNFKVSGDTASVSVRFSQTYRSASLNSTINKTLVLVRSAGKWLIVEERIG